MPQLVTVFTSANLMEAEQIRSLLEGNEIPALILDSHVSSLNPIWSAATGGVKVVVPEHEVEKVKDVFREYLQREEPLPLTGKSFHPYTDIMGGKAEPPKKPQDHCPSCKAPREPGANFCDQCARRLEGA